jgi:hypothetical protein
MTAGSTREFMAMCAIAQHFGRPGTPTDQAWIESLFSHIKADWPLGRDLRRRHGRHRDGRPAHPPRRDPQPQRRFLPAQGPRPRTATRPPDPRNRLTHTPRRPRPGPQNASQRANPSPSTPKSTIRGAKRDHAGGISPPLAYGSLREKPPQPLSGTLQSKPRESILNRRYGVNSQPALTPKSAGIAAAADL